MLSKCVQERTYIIMHTFPFVLTWFFNISPSCLGNHSLDCSLRYRRVCKTDGGLSFRGRCLGSRGGKGGCSGRGALAPSAECAVKDGVADGDGGVEDVERRRDGLHDDLQGVQ